MQCWINGPATGAIEDKIKMVNILLKTNIPTFHHSIIPFPGQIRRLQKTSIFSVGCRNSEKFNYTRDSIKLRGRNIFRHAREGGHPVYSVRTFRIPAFAGMTVYIAIYSDTLTRTSRKSCHEGTPLVNNPFCALVSWWR